MGTKMLKLKFRIIFYVLTCLAILVADLTIAFINKYVISYKGKIDKHLITLIGMAVVLIVFYILISNINKFSEYFVNRFVHITRVYLGRVIGLYIAVLIILFLLFTGYYWVWFDTSFYREIYDFILSIIMRIEHLF